MTTPSILRPNLLNSVLFVCLICMAFSGCSRKISSKESKSPESTSAKPRPPRDRIPTLSPTFLESIIISRIGETLTSTEMGQMRSSMSLIPELQDPRSKTEQKLIVRGEQGSEVVSITVRLMGDKIIAVDYTLLNSNSQARDLKDKLLYNFEITGERKITQLAPNLDTISVAVADYRNRLKGNLCASSFEAGGVTRVILFDPSIVDMERLIPTVEQLPPNLLENAKRALKKQREMHGLNK